jgi:hypothetical protein
MYTIADVLDLGEAHELILSDIKCEPSVDDLDPMTTRCEEFLDDNEVCAISVECF